MDVGLHVKGWSRDRAVKYLLGNPGEPEVDSVREVDRYIGWPGQALSYKCGQLKISAIRSKAEKALGGNTISYEQEPSLRRQVESLLRASPTSLARKLKLQCCLPLLPAIEPNPQREECQHA